MSLLKIEKDGTQLVLYPGTKVKFILKSPLFVYTPEAASRTLSFSVPAEPNDQLLGFTRLPENRAKSWSIDGFKVYIGGNFWKNARLYITGIRRKEYQVQLTFDKGYLAINSQRSMRDFALNKYGLPYRFLYGCLERDNFVFTQNVFPANYSITIDIIISGGTIRSYTFTYNPLLSLLDFTRDAAIEINKNFETDRVFAHCPNGALEIGYTTGYAVFSTTFTESSADISAVKTSYTSGSLDNQRTYISKLVNETETDDMIYFPVKNPGYYGSDITVVPSLFRSEWRNPFFPQTPPVADWFLLNQSYANAVTPFPFLYNALQSIHKTLGFNVEDSFFDDELKKLVVYSTFDQCTVYKIMGIDNFTISLFFKLQEAMPDISFSEFMHGIGTFFCTVFDYDTTSNKSRWIPRKTILKSAADNDWTNLVDVDMQGEYNSELYSLKYTPDPHDRAFGDKLKTLNTVIVKSAVDFYGDLPTSNNDINEVRLVRAENAYYICKLGGTDTWRFYCENLVDYNQENAKVIQPKCATVFTEWQDFTTIGGELYPKVKGMFAYANQTGRSQFGNTPFADFTLRLLFWRGLVPAVIGDQDNYIQHNTYQYPLGTYHNKDLLMNSIGNYSLAWNADDGGLKEVWWSDWLAFIESAEKYEWTALLGFNELYNIDLLKPKRINNQNYLIDEIELDIGDKIGKAKVTAYKR